MGPRTFATACGAIVQRARRAADPTLGPGALGLGTAEWGLRAGHCALLVRVLTHGHGPPHICHRVWGHCAAGTPRCGPHTRAWVLGPGHCGVGTAGWALRTPGARVDPRAWPPHICHRVWGHCAAGTPRCGPHTRAWVL